MTGDALVSVTESAGLSRFRPMFGFLLDSLDAGDDARSALRQAEVLQRKLDDALLLAVRQARSEGMTWEVIGDLLGVTKSAAHQRFSKNL